MTTHETSDTQSTPRIPVALFCSFDQTWISPEEWTRRYGTPSPSEDVTPTTLSYMRMDGHSVTVTASDPGHPDSLEETLEDVLTDWCRSTPTETAHWMVRGFPDIQDSGASDISPTDLSDT